MDGLKQNWVVDGAVWMNPPYGRDIGQWLKKASETADKGVVVVALLPARTDTKWWREYVMKATELRFVNGRIKFGDATQSAPFPSVIAVFGTPRVPVIKQVTINQ